MTRKPIYIGHQPPDVSGPGGRPCDDEEDCYIGSGSGEFNTDDGDITDIDKGMFTHRKMTWHKLIEA